MSHSLCKRRCEPIAMLAWNVTFAVGESRNNAISERERGALGQGNKISVSERGSHRPARKLASRRSTRPSGRVRIETYMSYRGIENFFGHVWKWVDGINVNNNRPYVSNNDTHFADDTLANYLDLGIDLHNASGWPVMLERIDRGFLPASVGGNSSTFLCDHYWQNPGWRIALLGATANSGANAGVASWLLDRAAGHRPRDTSGRLSF